MQEFGKQAGEQASQGQPVRWYTLLIVSAVREDRRQRLSGEAATTKDVIMKGGDILKEGRGGDIGIL